MFLDDIIYCFDALHLAKSLKIKISADYVFRSLWRLSEKTTCDCLAAMCIEVYKNRVKFYDNNFLINFTGAIFSLSNKHELRISSLTESITKS